MIEKTRVIPAQERKAPTPATVPNSLGLTETDPANTALDQLLSEQHRRKKEAKRLRDEQRTRLASAHRLEIQERRRARARSKYRQKVADRSKGAAN